jgi:hypothetical protein
VSRRAVLRPSLRGAIATKQSRTASQPSQAALDCFAEPVIGPRDFARVRWLAMTSTILLALRLLLAPRALCHGKNEQASRMNKGGGRAPKGAGVDTAGPLTSVAARFAFPRGACSFWEARSPLGALPRLSPNLAKPLGLGSVGSVRSRASWSRTTDPRPGQPAPGRPASWQAGRVSEPPANGVTSPIPGTAPARINRPSPVGVPSNEQDAPLYPKIGRFVKIKVTKARQPFHRIGRGSDRGGRTGGAKRHALRPSVLSSDCASLRIRVIRRKERCSSGKIQA